MNKHLKKVFVLVASVILIYGLITLRQDLAGQDFSWTVVHAIKYALITLTSVGLYAWSYGKKKNKK
jgi:hypothetical protein